MESEHPTDAQMFWQQFAGPNFGYLLELYEEYKKDPQSVSEQTRALFDAYGDPNVAVVVPSNMGSGQTNQFSMAPQKIAKAIELVNNIREFGHLNAAIDPVHERQNSSQLDIASYGLTESDLSEIPASVVWTDAPNHVRTAREAVDYLRSVYAGRHGYEFNHISNREERAWLQGQVESGQLFATLSADEKKQLYQDLAETELFEKFLHKRFAGQKRFSVEGLDAMVPMVKQLAHRAVAAGSDHVVIGMSHRGRLNVLAHVMNKPYEKIFSEFHAGNHFAGEDELRAYENGWGGDVKYHQGWKRSFETDGGREAHYILANNPSHLEVVNPVVQGITRAAQEVRTAPGTPVQDVDKALAVTIHGDAAFAGEGIVTETINLSQIPGYYTGGTVHIIANNHVGFTADPEQGRSTRYASDPAKGYEVPIVHVSADDPEACLAAIQLAFLYRKTFHKDFLIDLVGYRRWGHNEGDDPSMTQPVLYSQIGTHKTIKDLYGAVITNEGVVTDEFVQSVDTKINEVLLAAYQKMADEHDEPRVTDFAEQSSEIAPVSLDDLRELNESLLETPEDFTTYPKLKRILDRRKDAIDNGDIDWAHAETLAFATILQKGTPIRMTGQDSERGTFGQRHLVLHDVNDGHKYTPLQHIPGSTASFIVYNSALSETGVIGFEYGYNVQAPETLVLWEAQFGDFANVAQPMIDQFIASGRSKWGETSGLVMLLPHGFEGQASEHSSARLERFLQLAAKNNMVIANVTTSAQYFHLLRLQAARLGESARPLIVMTPKSLLRNARAASKGTELANSQFQPVLHAEDAKSAKKVTRLVLSSGKVGVDLTAELEKREGDFSWLATARVEQLYPFPVDQLQAIFSQYENLKEVVWLQEEPQNAGAWTYVLSKLHALVPDKAVLHYVGRPEQAFPAEGSPDVHNAEQAHIIDVVLNQQSL